MNFNYSTIKAMAKDAGKSPKEFLVLAQQNDPFYAGQKARVESAEWFAKLWNSEIRSGPIHTRGFHYLVISQKEKALMPDGTSYENTDRCWSYLEEASKTSRYLGLVDPRDFRDHRSQPTKIFAAKASSPFVDIEGEYGFDISFPDFPDVPNYSLNNFHGTQKYLIEVWAEKSSVEDELLPICKRFGCSLVMGLGEISYTKCVELVDRIIEYQRPTRILYVSDFDPAGRSMPVAISRKIEFLQRTKYPELDVQLGQVALTHDQCKKYKLPRTPIKDGKNNRYVPVKKKFEAIYGEGATELDALDALHPGELAKIVRKEIKRFYDDSLEDRVHEERDATLRKLDERWDDVVGQYADRVGELRTKYEDIKGRFEAEVETVKGEIEEIWRGINEQLEENTLEPEEIKIPEAEPDPANFWKSPIYKHDRSYQEQLDAYRKFKSPGRKK